MILCLLIIFTFLFIMLIDYNIVLKKLNPPWGGIIVCVLKLSTEKCDKRNAPITENGNNWKSYIISLSRRRKS
jgi:hypothetical protein